LSEGRRLQGDVEIPERIDLKNPYNMKYEDRWKLYFHWLNLYKNYESDVLRMTSEDFPGVYKEYEQMREIEDVRTMKDALVVGMTTTSAARLRSSLQTLKNPIVIVEEAAEVLEAHIVTSITKHCKHLILIGDHKQLRPNTANYSMEKKYHLGTSLFERMIINDVHCYTLNVQHRMRPEISCLIRPTIYDFVALRNATMAISRSRRPRGPTYARGANRSQFEDPELAVNARHLAARRAHPAFKFFYVAHSGSGRINLESLGARSVSLFAGGPFCGDTSGSRCDAAPGVISVVVSRRVPSASGSSADIILGAPDIFF
jgi:hypothetical protein